MTVESLVKGDVCAGKLLELRKQNLTARPRVIFIIKGRHGSAAARTCVGTAITGQPLMSAYFVVGAGRRAEPADVLPGWDGSVAATLLTLRGFRTS